MDIKKLKEKLTVDHIITLMQDFGENYSDGMNENEIKFRTVCHGGNSHKLYFYKNTMNFHCYTHCGSFDVIGLVQKLMGCDFQKAVEYISNRFGLGYLNFNDGFDNQNEDISSDWKILNRLLEDNHKVEEKWIDFKEINDKVFNIFYDMYHRSFLDDGINISTMQKYELMFDIGENRIIIPHRNEDGSLVAIRCRNLEQKLIDSGRKYMPIIHKGQILSAPISQYLYGLYYNKENIIKSRKVILVESEKAVMQINTMFPMDNISLALSSSSLSNFQVKRLVELGVEEVVIALDKEYKDYDSNERRIYEIKLKKTIIDRLKPYFMVSVIMDKDNLLGYKQSPTDHGKDVFLELYKNRIVV